MQLLVIAQWYNVFEIFYIYVLVLYYMFLFTVGFVKWDFKVLPGL